MPTVQALRWPILVALDTLGADEVLDLEARVVEHLDMSDAARAIVDPSTGRSLLVQRMMQAIEDLYQAGAVEPELDADVIRITDAGRRLSESDVVALSVSIVTDEGDPDSADEVAPSPQPEKPSIGDWIFAFLDNFHPS